MEAHTDPVGHPNPTGHPGELADRVWAGLRALVLDRHARRKEVSAALDMSFIRVRALRRLATGPMQMRELSEALSTDKPYTTLVVDDLEQRGLVTRQPHPDDRRAKIVAVTPDGAAAAAKAEVILADVPPSLRTLDPADLRTLDRIVTTLLDTDDVHL